VLDLVAISSPRSFLWYGIQGVATMLRVFTWFLLMDQLNTRNILKRKKLQNRGEQLQLCPMHIQNGRNCISPLLWMSVTSANNAVKELGRNWIWHFNSLILWLPQITVSPQVLHGGLVRGGALCTSGPWAHNTIWASLETEKEK
jgi:hypothetical protein